MWIFDRHGGAVLAANDAALRAYGYALQLILRCHVDDLCSPRDPCGGLLSTPPSNATFWSATRLQTRRDGSTFEADLATIDAGDASYEATMVLVQPKVLGPPMPRATGASTADAASTTLLGRAKSLTRRLEPELDEAHSRSSFVLVDAQALAEQVGRRVRPAADAKDVDVVLHCTCRCALVQPITFSEALYELLDSAVRATRRGHPVMVDVRTTGRGDVIWQIQDTGQRRPTATGPDDGVEFAKAVIEKHGGTLTFESAPGVGTTASIWLPTERPHPGGERRLTEVQR